MKNIRLLIMIFISGCSMSGGTHGSIKGFQYRVSKYVLQNAVNSVIATNKNMSFDKSRSYNDTLQKDYYNDGNDYITIIIKKRDIINDYTLKYAGDKKYWDTSKVSSIFISYAYDKDGNGGSEGNGGFPWYKFFFKKKMIDFFETEFINKVDVQLHQKHRSTD